MTTEVNLRDVVPAPRLSTAENPDRVFASTHRSLSWHLGFAFPSQQVSVDTALPHASMPPPGSSAARRRLFALPLAQCPSLVGRVPALALRPRARRVWQCRVLPTLPRGAF